MLALKMDQLDIGKDPLDIKNGKQLTPTKTGKSAVKKYVL